MSPTKRTRKPSAKAVAAQQAEQSLDDETITVESTSVEHHERDVSPANVQASILLITRQSQGIDTVRSELIEIKEEQRALKAQNAELQEEPRSLRAQLQSYSASTSSARSYASVAASTPATQSTTSLISSGASERTRKEVNCLRISTQASQQRTEAYDNSFARYFTPARAKDHIENALRQAEATKEVKVAGVGTTTTGYVIRFKEEQSFITAEANTEWLNRLGNDTKRNFQTQTFQNLSFTSADRASLLLPIHLVVGREHGGNQGWRTDLPPSIRATQRKSQLISSHHIRSVNLDIG